MKTVVQLVDTKEYIRGNCFQHQLALSLDEECDLIQVELSSILSGHPQPRADVFVSCLKQRTLDKHLASVKQWLNGKSITIYDQDPWQAYMDDSPYKGAYDRFVSELNVKTFALTTDWWVKFLQVRGMPATFVRMWVLPEYCVTRLPYVFRDDIAGFVGTVHPRRQQLLDIIEASGIKTSVLRSNSLEYGMFLTRLSMLRIFVHNEDMPIFVDGQEHNFNTGMWVKDIEAASQGCFSIRNADAGSASYFNGMPQVDGQGLIRLCEKIEDVPEMIRDIERMDPDKRQNLIDRTREYIRQSDRWKETAKILIA